MQPFSEALLSIYDSAIDLSQWSDSLDLCVQAVGARSASLQFQETNPRTIVNHWGVLGGALRQIAPEHIQHYHENLLKYEEEGWAMIMQSPRQTIFSDQDFWDYPDEVLLQREDYAYMLKHLGVLRRIGVRLNDYPVWSDMVAFQFGPDVAVIPKESHSTLQQLLPHMGKAIEMGRTFNLLRARYQAALAALDHVEVGMCIALPDGSIIVSNEESQRIFSLEDGLSMDKNRRLVTRYKDDGELVQQAIETLASTSMGQGDATENIFAIKRLGNTNPYLLEVSPLRDAQGELEDSLYGALITIIDPDNTACVNVSGLVTGYGLTPAEADVTQRLVEGWTLNDIADDRNVSPQTIKTQTTSIMQKAGVCRRAELIRLALRLSPPIALKRAEDN